MHEVHLFRPENGGSEHLNGVMDDLGALASQGGKVYRTYVKDINYGNYVLVTTSKEIHLFFGRMSDKGQFHLCQLLSKEFLSGNCNELLLFVDSEKERGGVLVTVPKLTDTDVTFHFSPAH